MEIQDDTKPDSGKIWVPYINSKREDWSFLCENNRIVCQEDEILFKYEDPIKESNTPSQLISVTTKQAHQRSKL